MSSATAGVRRVTVPRPENFDEEGIELTSNGQLDRAREEGGNLFVLFEGAKDASGHSWCGDCVAAEPAINAAMERATGTLLVCPVERSEYKGNPEYPYRTHALIKLKSVPTLLKWGPRRKPVARLEEAQCADAHLVEELVNEE